MLQETSRILVSLLLAYVLLIGLGAWLVLDARRRQALQQHAQDLALNLTHQLTTNCASLGQCITRSRILCLNATMQVAAISKTYPWQISIAVIILCIPTTTALFMQPSRALSGYQDVQEIGNPVVRALLLGEQLMPPPPLPPNIFLTQEVALLRQNLAGANREWALLDADFRQRLLTVFYLMAQKGYPMALLEGYRSPERQSHLASLGSHVTSAGAYQSFHQFGLAADVAFVRDGKLVISEKDAWALQGYQLYGELAVTTGLVWGGHWKMRDFAHVELRNRKPSREQQGK